MIISKKKYQEAISEAVNKAMCERDRAEYENSRFHSMERDMERRFDQYNRRLLELEKQVFPERFNKPHCPMEVRDLTSC